MAEESASWYVRSRGRVRGPFALSQLELMRNRGQLAQFDEVSQDRKSWSPAGRLPALFAQTPRADAPGGSDASTKVTAPVQSAEGWHCNTPVGAVGPVAIAQVVALIHSGQLNANSAVWRPGFHAWMALRDVPELSCHLPSAQLPGINPRPGGATAGKPSGSSAPASIARATWFLTFLGAFSMLIAAMALVTLFLSRSTNTLRPPKSPESRLETPITPGVADGQRAPALSPAARSKAKAGASGQPAKAQSPAASPGAPVARFFAIPRNMPDTPPGSGERESLRLEKDIRDVEIMQSGDHKLDVRKSGDAAITILKPSDSRAKEPSEIARIGRGEKMLSFQWESGMARHPETKLEVLDSVIRLRCADGEIQYVLLRDPKTVNNAGALRLVSNRTEKDSHSVVWSAKWASDRDALLGTKQKFRARRWQIVCKKGPEVDSFVIASEDGATSADDEESILDGAASFRIWIDSAVDAGVIRARFQTVDRFKDRSSEGDAKLGSRLRALEYAEGDPNLQLSAVICLELADGTLLDIARFGDFESPNQ